MEGGGVAPAARRNAVAWCGGARGSRRRQRLRRGAGRTLIGVEAVDGTALAAKWSVDSGHSAAVSFRGFSGAFHREVIQ